MKKIMFNDLYCLTQAVLDGRKTMTRRIENLSSQFIKGLYDEYIPINEGDLFRLYNRQLRTPFIHKTRYSVNEEVAIAQQYSEIADSISIDPSSSRAQFVCDVMISSYTQDEITRDINEGEFPAWNNKMFVKAEFMPNRIKITDVRIERLQDISDEDCLREGVELNQRNFEVNGEKLYCVDGLKYYRAMGCTQFDTPREAFAALIDKVSGKGTWESNPFVFVYEFELQK